MTKKDIFKEMKTILAKDRDFLKPLLTELIQKVLEAEMDKALEAGSYERIGQRKGYRSGY